MFQATADSPVKTSSHKRLRSLIVLDPAMADRLYGEAGLCEIAKLTDLIASPLAPGEVRAYRQALDDAEVWFTGWSCPKVDAELLALAPRLRAIFFAGGTVRPWITEAVWDRQITVASAYAANATSVAEYTLAAILFSLKRGWHYVARQQREHIFPLPLVPAPGAYGATVGLISLGAVARRVRELLRPFDVNVIAYDPFVSATDASRLGVTLVELNEVFSRSDVVSLHAPLLKSTAGLITGAHFKIMKSGGSFINTARGAIVREAEMADVLAARSDLTALLDVFSPEPPSLTNPLLRLPNVIVTPHIAGAIGHECLRLGRLMIDEFIRWQKNQPMQWQITRENSALLA